MLPDRQPDALGSAGAHQTLRSMMNGYKVAMAVRATAALGIADALADRPRSAAEVAADVGLHPPSTQRFMRLVAALGLCEQLESGDYSLTVLGELLRSDAPHSDRRWVIKEGTLWWQGWDHLEQALREGRPGFELATGQGLFAYLASPAAADVAGEILAALTSGGSQARTQELLTAYDFSSASLIADVGGGNGELLIALLERYPQARGLLCEQPYVLAYALTALEQGGVAERCALQPLDFMRPYALDADAVLMRSVLHDWSDEEASLILRQCRAAVAEGTLLLVIEVLARGDDAQQPALDTALRDVNLMVMTPGRKRTAAELEVLLATADFAVTRVIDTGGSFSIVEAFAGRG